MAGPRAYRGIQTQPILNAPIFQGRSALATTGTTETLTTSQLQSGQLAITPAQAVTATLPTAASLVNWLGNDGTGYVLIENIAGTGSITLAAGTGGTLYEVVANGEIIASGAKTMAQISMTSATAYNVFLTKFIAV